MVGDASTGEGSTRRLRRERRQGHQGLGTAARMSNVCVCVYPTAVGRTVPVPGKWVRVARWDSGMAVPMKCFCSTFLQHLREPTRPSQNKFPGFSAPFSAPLRRHYKRICGGEGGGGEGGGGEGGGGEGCDGEGGGGDGSGESG